MTITEKLQNDHASFSRRAQEIRAEWTHSDAAKRQELEGLYTEARSTHEQLTSQYRKDLSERLQKTRSEALATPRVGKDSALDVLVYRGALDRISKTRDTRELTHPRACPHDRRQGPGEGGSLPWIRDTRLGHLPRSRRAWIPTFSVADSYRERQPDAAKHCEQYKIARKRREFDKHCLGIWLDLPSGRSREPGRGYEGRAVELVRPAQTEEKKGL